MAEEGKKISFGFSKTVKKPLIKNAAPVEEKIVDYIECVDDKAIKIIGNEEKKNEPLVIPMLGSKTWHDRIINKVDADIFEPKQTDKQIKEEPNEGIEIKQEKNDTITNGNAQEESLQPMEIDGVKIKEEPKDPEPSKPMTLEHQAAQEILADLKAEENKSSEQKAFTVPISEDDLKGKEESTLEDYEKIPIEAFGMAMLRGMGWKAEEGVGKNAKVIAPSIPELRPKGMGLGADKLAIQKTKAKLTKEEESLKIVKGCCVKIISGKRNGNYGKIEGLDEETGRILVRLALGNEIVSLVNELLVQPVTNEEYSKNSRVLNMKAYEEHKSKENNVKITKKERGSPKNEEDNDNDDRDRRCRKSKKKSKNRKDESSEDESSPERKSRKKRDSSNSSDDYSRRKNSKKSKKHNNRDSSSERSNRKKKKKDKEREKSRYKKSDYSDSSERARKRDRKRSRSRSHSPKNRRKNRSRSYSPKR